MSEAMGEGRVVFRALGDNGEYLEVEGHSGTLDFIQQAVNQTLHSKSKVWMDARKAFCDFGFESVTWRIEDDSDGNSGSLVVGRYEPTIKDSLPNIANRVPEERSKAKILPARN